MSDRQDNRGLIVGYNISVTLRMHLRAIQISQLHAGGWSTSNPQLQYFGYTVFCRYSQGLPASRVNTGPSNFLSFSARCDFTGFRALCSWADEKRQKTMWANIPTSLTSHLRGPYNLICQRAHIGVSLGWKKNSWNNVACYKVGWRSRASLQLYMHAPPGNCIIGK